MNDVKIYLIGDGLVNSNHIIFGDDLTLSREMEGGQRFFRTKITGKIKFTSENFEQIYNSDPNFRWQVQYYMVERGVETLLANGYFYKYDCAFDVDNKVCEVEPIVQDNYTKLLAGLDKVYNIVELAPITDETKITKRVCFQYYTPMDNKLTNVIGGSSFEVDCNQKTEEELPSLYFTRIKSRFYISIPVGLLYEQYRDEFGVYCGLYESVAQTAASSDGVEYLSTNNNGCKIIVTQYGSAYVMRLFDSGETEVMRSSATSVPTTSGEVVNLQWENYIRETISDSIPCWSYANIWCRMICDSTALNTHPIPQDDIVDRNLNYRYCKNILPSRFSSIVMGGETSDEPTRWGKIPGTSQYYKKPQEGMYPLVAVGKTYWNVASYWIEFQMNYSFDAEEEVVSIRDTYFLWSVIERLISKIDPSISFGGISSYSQFLFSTLNPITNEPNGRLMVAPITNIKSSYYSSPAQRGDISLSMIFDMLKKTFRCYWFIDADKKLRIEHISWFKYGEYIVNGSVSTTILKDITSDICPIVQKPWSFGKNGVSFEKKSVPNRYEVGWADKCSEIFEGYAVDVKDECFSDCQKEENQVEGFVTDIDTIVSSPQSFSDDILVLMRSNPIDKNVYIDYFKISNTSPLFKLQNYSLCFAYLEKNFYCYDIGGRILFYDDDNNTEYQLPYDGDFSKIRFMKQESVSCPMSQSEAMGEGAVKTEVGDGEFHKLEWNLQSKMATLELFFAPK